MDDILNLTYKQFGNIVDGIGKEINWRLKLALLPVSVSENPPITEEDFPLFTKKDEEEKQQVFRLKDALALQSMANS